MAEIIKGLIFDMDGIMFDTERMLAKYWNIAAKEYGYNMELKHSIAIRSTGPEESEKILKDFFGKDFDYIKIRNRRRELMNADIEKNGLPLKKGLREILKKARELKLKTAVATATDEKRTEWYLKRENLLEYFDAITTTHMVEHGKPYPDIYLFAAKKLDLKPNECIAFEDSPNGIKSAYRAGCKVYMIPDLTDSDEELDKMLWKKSDSLLDAIKYI